MFRGYLNTASKSRIFTTSALAAVVISAGTASMSSASQGASSRSCLQQAADRTAPRNAHEHHLHSLQSRANSKDQAAKNQLSALGNDPYIQRLSIVARSCGGGVGGAAGVSLPKAERKESKLSQRQSTKALAAALAQRRQNFANAKDIAAERAGKAPLLITVSLTVEEKAVLAAIMDDAEEDAINEAMWEGAESACQSKESNHGRCGMTVNTAGRFRNSFDQVSASRQATLDRIYHDAYMKAKFEYKYEMTERGYELSRYYNEDADLGKKRYEERFNNLRTAGNGSKPELSVNDALNMPSELGIMPNPAE